jgi:hypothetical protein
MTTRDRDIDDWFRRFMGSRRWSPWGAPTEGMFREFEEMKRDMERMFEETIQDMERVPKELVREYETPSGKVKEVGPLSTATRPPSDLMASHGYENLGTSGRRLALQLRRC